MQPSYPAGEKSKRLVSPWAVIDRGLWARKVKGRGSRTPAVPHCGSALEGDAPAAISLCHCPRSHRSSPLLCSVRVGFLPARCPGPVPPIRPYMPIIAN